MGRCDSAVSDAPEHAAPIEGNVTLFSEGDSFRRQPCVLPHLVVGLIQQALPLRIVTTDPRAVSLAMGPVAVHLRKRSPWLFADRAFASLVDALSATPPTVIHALSHESYSLTRDLAEEFDAELLWSVGGWADLDAVRQQGLARVDALVSHGRAMLEPLQRQLGVHSEKLHVISPGVLAAPSPGAFSDARRIPALVSLAPLDEGGGVESLIQAVDLLRRRSRPVALFLLGEGRGESRLRRKVRDLRLASSVTFAHPTGDVGPALSHADVFVRAKQVTVFEDDLLQAMAAGLAVVCGPSDVDDGIRDGETAILCDPTAPESIAEAVEGLLADLANARRVAQQALEYVREHHTLSGMADQAGRVYRVHALRRATFSVEGG